MTFFMSFLHESFISIPLWSNLCWCYKEKKKRQICQPMLAVICFISFHFLSLPSVPGTKAKGCGSSTQKSFLHPLTFRHTTSTISKLRLGTAGRIIAADFPPAFPTPMPSPQRQHSRPSFEVHKLSTPFFPRRFNQ
jgi:hypothetical protein